MFHTKRPLSWYWHPLTSDSVEAKNQYCKVFENIIWCKLNILFKTTNHVRVKLMGSQSHWVKLHQLGRNLGRFHAEKGLMRNTQDKIISV
jgi:hypothetical protein